MEPELRVDLDAIVENWRSLAARHGAPTAAVVKADGYGLGAIAVARRLQAAGAEEFFVAHLNEGATLRPHLPGARIHILNGLSASDAATYSDLDLTPVLGSAAEIAAWQAHARRLGRKLPALLHIDTGMNRLGLCPRDLALVAGEPERLAGIDIRFVMTHLVDAERPDDPRNAAQLDRFNQACARLPPAPRSLANSSGIFLDAAFRSDLARPGAALYGINPTPGRANPMRPTMRLTARVLQLRDIAPGEAVGYNGIWRARRPTRVATVALGYADGYHRAASTDGAPGSPQLGYSQPGAAFDGGRLPLIGRISMDLTTFDATDHPRLAPGDALELIGPAIPPDEVAIWAGTNGYEVLTSLRGRPIRTYAPL